MVKPSDSFCGNRRKGKDGYANRMAGIWWISFTKSARGANQVSGLRSAKNI